MIDPGGRDLGERLTSGSSIAWRTIRLRVDEPRGLLLDRRDDARVAVAHGDHADPGREVEELPCRRQS